VKASKIANKAKSATCLRLWLFLSIICCPLSYEPSWGSIVGLGLDLRQNSLHDRLTQQSPHRLSLGDYNDLRNVKS